MEEQLKTLENLVKEQQEKLVEMEKRYSEVCEYNKKLLSNGKITLEKSEEEKEREIEKEREEYLNSLC